MNKTISWFDKSYYTKYGKYLWPAFWAFLSLGAMILIVWVRYQVSSS